MFNKCHVCDQSFINDIFLKQHYKMEHSDITMEENKKGNKIRELTFIVDGGDWIEIAGKLEVSHRTPPLFNCPSRPP